MQPGAGYDEHIDEHDVAIIVFSGMVETLGQRAGPGESIYYAGGEPMACTILAANPPGISYLNFMERVIWRCL